MFNNQELWKGAKKKAQERQIENKAPHCVYSLRLMWIWGSTATQACVRRSQPDTKPHARISVSFQPHEHMQININTNKYVQYKTSEQLHFLNFSTSH